MTVIALGIVLLGVACAHADAPDTLRVSFELGASSDVSSEQFFEDAFLDSIALGLHSVSTPESRVAAVAHATLAGTRGGRASAFRLDNELSWGDLVRLDELSAEWRSTGRRVWGWGLAPRAEVRHDRTFGRDLEQARVSAAARLRRTWRALDSAAELSGRGDWLRTRGTGADFLPDRNAGGVTLRFERAPAMGSEWRLGYGVTSRVFPDSTVRDHLEQRVEAVWKRDMEAGHRFEVDLECGRRRTVNPAPTSQDRYREAELSATVELAMGLDWGLSLACSAERFRYEESDRTAFFDYDLARAELRPRWSSGGWSARLGPRAEWLRSPVEPGEEYAEIAGAGDVEWVRGGLWSLSPSSGWRQYRSLAAPAPAAGALPITASRSSYAFGQIDALVDQELPGAFRVRLFGSCRLESHTDSAENARSLYISLDVRRLF